MSQKSDAADLRSAQADQAAGEAQQAADQKAAPPVQQVTFMTIAADTLQALLDNTGDAATADIAARARAAVAALPVKA